MLRYLRIRNLAILEEVEIRFEAGLNLITGETGAGKSIVVDALGLVMGRRADADLVRSGADQAVVEAVFDVDGRSEIPQRLQELGLEPCEDDEDLVIRREIGRGGSRGFINGSPVTAGMLRRLAPLLAEVHGQHQHQTLLREEGHLALLDAFAGAADLAQEVAAEHGVFQKLQERLQSVHERRQELSERLDVLSFRLREFDSVDPASGEDEDLRRRRELLAHSGEISGLVDRARFLIEESEEGSLLSQAAELELSLRRLAELDPAAGRLLEDAGSARSILVDLAAAMRGRPAATEFDPSELETVEERLSQLAALARKHGGSLEEALKVRDRTRAELEDLQADLEDPAVLEAETDAAGQRLLASARRLSDLRRRKAGSLQRAVEKELGELAMAGTSFQVLVDWNEAKDGPFAVEGRSVRCGVHGLDHVRFLLSANTGEEPRPLARIASGGELSRLMLALEGALRAGKRRTVLPACLVFDEVDAGIGGRVAAVVGGKLKELTRDRQVLCVTHLAQIASLADAHFRIEKRVDKGRTRTRVRALEREDRVKEIARMLAGRRVTQATRQHAAEMIGKPGPAVRRLAEERR